MRVGRIIVSYLTAAAFLCMLWTCVAYIMELPIVPPPSRVLSRLVLVFFDSIAVHGAYSLFRIGAGLLMAVIIGYPLGVLMGYCRRVDRILSPFVYLTYPIPKIALLPILMLLAGIGELSKILMIFLIIVFQVVIAVRDGVRAIPSETYFPLRSLGASFGQILRHVIFPAVLPKFITAIRVAMATAVSVLFFTETFGTQYGMGYYIMDAWLRVNYLDMYAGIVTLSAMGLSLFGLIDCFEHFTCHWQER